MSNYRNVIKIGRAEQRDRHNIYFMFMKQKRQTICVWSWFLESYVGRNGKIIAIE